MALRATEQPIDTGTAAGKAFLDMLGVFAKFDSNEGGHLFQSDRGHHSNMMAASLVSSRGPVLVMS